MIVSNTKMFHLLLKMNRTKTVLLKKMKPIIADGLVQQDNNVFLNYFYSANPHVEREHFFNDTAYENFINGFHIDDYCKRNHLENALLFADKFIEIWNNQVGKKTLEIVISQTEYGYHFSAHSFRKKEIFININDIEKFDEAVLIIRYCTIRRKRMK